MFNIPVGEALSRIKPSGNFNVIPANILDPQTASRVLSIMEHKVKSNLRPLETKIHPKLTKNQKLNYGEKIHKVMRVKTFRIENSKHEALWNSYQLEQLVSPQLARKVCEKLFQCKFRKEVGKQIVSYFEGDYFGPHNDHHPELPHMKNGYVDFHYYVNHADVEYQMLVHEDRGHLNKFYSLNHFAGLNVYRLPFWHYTSPLQVKPGSSKKAARWIIMYTFYFEQPTKNKKKAPKWGP